MKIAITGSSGMVGTALRESLRAGGHDCLRLVRRPAVEPDELSWDPEEGITEPQRLEGIDAVVHLAGENISGRRWSVAFKEKIRVSRVVGTRVLAEALAGLEQKPRVLVSASAVGYYGSRGTQTLTEASAPGHDFLAQVCQSWEASTKPASEAGIRVAVYRFGMILDAHGGALAKMLFPFKMGVGGVIGSGQQIWSWVSKKDVVRGILHAIESDAISGPVNLVSPQPVSNRQFTKTLGRVLRRPTIFPMPAFVARAAFGKMADALILTSQSVNSARLTSTGFQFEDPELEGCLRSILN